MIQHRVKEEVTGYLPWHCVTEMGTVNSLHESGVIWQIESFIDYVL